jgi:hypothetical protein
MLTACVQRLPGTPLGNAARSGDVAEIDRLISAGADVNEPSYLPDWPPVIHAISKGHSQALVRLKERGASLDGPIGEKAIFMASSYGDVDALNLLLSWGVALPQEASTAASLLAVAVGGSWDYGQEWSGCERHTAIVRLLLAREPGLRAARTSLSAASVARARSTLEHQMARLHARFRDCDELVQLSQ